MDRSTKTILFIDDHANALAGWSLYLHELGYGVASAANPEEGLQRFATTSIDAVILDYSMPDMDGGEVAAAMKQIKPEVPIILFSGAEVPASARGLADALIAKGSPPQVLLAKLDQLLFPSGHAATP